MKAAKEQQLENIKKAKAGELNYDVRCQAELAGKRCVRKNNKKAPCRFWHAPDGKGGQPKYIWDADLGECVEHDQPTFKSKWGAFCARCAAAKAGGADCFCGTCSPTS